PAVTASGIDRLCSVEPISRRVHRNPVEAAGEGWRIARRGDEARQDDSCHALPADGEPFSQGGGGKADEESKPELEDRSDLVGRTEGKHSRHRLKDGPHKPCPRSLSSRRERSHHDECTDEDTRGAEDASRRAAQTD